MTRTQVVLLLGFELAVVLLVVAMTYLVFHHPADRADLPQPEAAPAAFGTTAPDDAEPRNYPLTTIAVIAAGKWDRPRASVVGTVTYRKREADGDEHFRVEDGAGAFIVCEEIPELRFTNGYPKVGDRVRVWGVVRYDAHPGHRWYELHPALFWEQSP